MGSTIEVTEYTDAACPWAWSAEPMKRRLRWLYGDALEWRTRMIVLSSDREHYVRIGYTPEMLAEGFAEFAERYGMPLDATVRARMGATKPAARAVVAARAHAGPALAEALLRRLRVHAMTIPTAQLDEPETIVAAASEAGIDPAVLERWLSDPAVDHALARDMAAARAPGPAAVALSGKLARVTEDPSRWRYTAPSLVFTRPSDRVTIEAPGFQPALAYEVAVANLDPELPRRAEPESVDELLAWAPEPLATQEVAVVMGISREDARARLAATTGVVEQAAGSDAFWSVEAAEARRAA
ncbi:DsbA family protein [Conexibacter woesei]|uniref:DSBA oxidoreductase n=1 Tax=Conexibacter woesei (strain DSM 14684 / CCUG 47730 / CIP 108061 / JCM 11494 / NBRC 100937 / ID131577) TaxID=469383 RepID=D3EZC8_CONWI|nr:DsbA family protein [Conexibacter woesei]ADB51893.1 DSBA oxidoreductase [Conexibacter woesei DSM 14684]